jgi:hypothetical protein
MTSTGYQVTYAGETNYQSSSFSGR